MAYIYTYYGFDTKKLYCELDAQYNEEDKLFNNLNDNFLWIENCGVDNSTEFEIEEGLVNWFNTNIEADYNNGSEMSDYYFVLYSFYGTKISEELQVDVLKEELDIIIGDISNEETDVDSLVMAFEYSYYLGKQDKELEIQITELYGQLSDSKDFWYDLEQETGVLHMLWFLNDYNNAFGSIYNEYLKENISDMLEEHYEKYYK